MKDESSRAGSGGRHRGEEETRTQARAEVLEFGPSSSWEVDGLEALLPENAPTVISNLPPIGDGVDVGVNPRDARQSLAGQALGHFELLELVGGGGMGAVYKAHDRSLGRTVAVKVVAGSQAEAENLKRFRNEAQSAARLDHPNIAQVYYVGEENGWNYIVFEFIEGANIRDLVGQRGPLPVAEALSYTLQIADALEHSSQRDVIHRDIKPSNILVMPNGRAKLVDMGLARLRHVETSSHDLTASGVTLGTFDYISPEQARDPREADVRSDIYSLGCTLYFMLTGNPPFPDGTVLQKLLSHSGETPLDVRDVRSDVADEIVAILTKMLAKRPQDRYQEPSELIGELLLTINRLNLPVVHRGGTVWITPATTTTAWWERHLSWFVPLVCLGLTVSAIDYFSRTAPQKHTPRTPEFQGTIDLAKLEQPEKVRPPLSLPEGEFRERRPSDSDSSNDSTGAVRDTVPADEPPSPVPDPQSEPLLSSLPSFEWLKYPKSWLNPDEAPEFDTGATERMTVPPPGSREASRAASDGLSDPAPAAEHGRDDADTAAPPIPELAVTRVIVGDDPLPPPPGATRVVSLDEAWQVVLEARDVNTIELAYDGERRSAPLDLTGIKPDREISIQAASGYAPVVLFAPSTAELGLGQQPAMIRHSEGKFIWQDVHFRFVLPSIEEARQSWSLFHLDRLQRLALRKCTLTIENARPAGDTLHERVAFFEFAVPSVSDMMPDAPEQKPAENMIKLAHCVIRGEATLVRAQEAVPFELTWQQGLFVSTEYLVWTGGARKPAGSTRSYLELLHVTAVMDRGFGLVQIGRGHQPNLETNCNHCIFVNGAGRPLFEHTDAESIEKAKTLFRIRGNDNFYPRTAVRWKLIPAAESPREYPMGALSQGEDWYQEQGASTNVMWQSAPKYGVAKHTHTPADYLIEVDKGDLTTRGIAGFDPQQLPVIPTRDAPAPPAGAESLPDELRGLLDFPGRE